MSRAKRSRTRKRPASHAAPGRRPPRTTQSQKRRRTLGLGGAAAVVGLVVGLTQVSDWIWDKLNPDSAPISGRITRVDLLRNERYGDFLTDTKQPATGLDERDLRALGNVVSLRVRIRGLEGDRLPVRWALVDAASGMRVPDPGFEGSDLSFVPSNDDHTGRGRIWVPIPNEEGEFFVRITIERENGVLDQADTPPFQTAAL